MPKDSIESGKPESTPSQSSLEDKKIESVNPYDEILETYSSYSTHAGGKETTIFGMEEPELDYLYSDRIEEDRDLVAAARKKADESGAQQKTARWFQNYLSAYLGYPIELKRIVIGSKPTNGLGYQIFGFRKVKDDTQK